jgi:hypothetical protein
MTAANDLVRQWREDAEVFQRYEDERTARLLLAQAGQLEEALQLESNRLLSTKEAAAESGYSEEHLRRLARNGELPVQRNGGPKSRLYIRRGDLPTKRLRDGREESQNVTYDPVEDARDIAKIVGGIS